MRPGSTGRNAVVGYGYLILIPFLLVFFPIVLGVAVGTNWRGTADRLAALPGVGAGGGVKTGVVAGIYGFVIWGVIIAGGGADDSGESVQASADLEDVDEAADEADDVESSDGEEGNYTVVVTVVDGNSDPIESAEVEFVHDDAMILNTREDQQTNQEGQATFETEGGSVRVNAEADGYESERTGITIESDDEVHITLESEPEPEPVEADDSATDTDDTVYESEIVEDEIDPADVGNEADSEALESEEPDLTAEQIESVFDLTLKNEGFDLHSATHVDNEFVVEYTSAAMTEDQLIGEIGYMTGAYTSMTTQGHGGDQMIVRGYALDGTHAFTYTVDAERATAWHDNEISDYEFFTPILESLEAHD